MKVRIGIIGSGFAALHVAALQKIKEAEVVAICSRNKRSAAQIIGNSQIKYYAFEDYEQMLKQENLDAVYICLPPFLHGEIELTCVKYVKALFIEKPVILDYQKGKELLKTFKKEGTMVSVGYMNRYRENLKIAKEYFSKHKPVVINASWSDVMPPPYWWRQRELSGGQLTEQCTHFIDAIRYIAGEITEVSAYATKGFIDNVEDFNVDDAVVMNFKLASGAIGNVITACFSENDGGGALGLFANISSREKTFRFTNHSMDLQIQHSGTNTETMPLEKDIILVENQAFINAIIQKNENLILSSYEEALETVKVGFAADISVKEKRIVKLSEV